MQITKIKWSKGEVRVSWTSEDGPSSNKETTLKSSDTPKDSFKDAFDGFKPYVARLLEVPQDWVDAADVTGVSINVEGDERRGLVVTISRPVDGANSPVTVNTPHVREKMVGDDEGQPWMDSDLVSHLDAMEAEARAYVQGDRLQQDMFADGGQSDKPVADSGPATERQPEQADVEEVTA